MPAESTQRKDYKTLSSSPGNEGPNPRDIGPLPSPQSRKNGTSQNKYQKNPASPVNENQRIAAAAGTDTQLGAEIAPSVRNESIEAAPVFPEEPATPDKGTKKGREAKKKQKDKELLTDDR